ncbi:MAG TPA: GH92 family glycosyl hydrolase [Puia sp.]|nr:GH92 family glycosyl hydrolase [Puia sp.]
MNIQYNINICLSALLLTITSTAFSQQQPAPADYVNPYIGTGGHGHTFLGASVPFGAIQAGPENSVQGWDWCSGYHYSDSIVIGFSQTHLSGTGIADLGDILVMPYAGPVKTAPGGETNPEKVVASHYTHAKEKVSPAYYALTLDDYPVKVELTASERVAFHKYSFLQAGQSHILIDLKQGIYSSWESPKAIGYLKKLNDSTLIGFRHSKGWAKDRRLYFAIRISAPLKDFALYDDSLRLTTSAGESANLRGLITFDKTPGEVMLKIGISPVSSEGAIANIEAEIPDWDFSKVVAQSTEKWNKELGKIKIGTPDTITKTVFYTAYYHTMIAPALFNDHDGSYRGTDKKVYTNPGFDNYSIFSLWDIYRSCAPLSTILHPDKVNSIIHSLLAIYQQQGKLPVWPLLGNETDCMVGYSAVPLVADAWLKGFTGFDADLAYQAVKASSMRNDLGLDYVKERGYIPADQEHESVSKAEEYAVDDWCIAQMAKRRGNKEDYAYYTKRAGYYKNYFDSTIGFVRPRMSDGSWKTPYDPIQAIHENGDFTEGNGWQYTWLAPQDPHGLIRELGGDSAFTVKLDSLFLVSGNMGAQASPDITGLIGMYAHGDEPSHHISYLYAFAGYPWKTAEKVRRIMKEFYTDQPDGLAGNEDCGAMSAWYVFSALGFYPVQPAGGVYVLGSPLFKKATLQLPDNKQFTVETVNNSAANIYIRSVELNGKPYRKSYITHKDIMQGGLLKITMGSSPDPNFGKAVADRPGQ